MNTDAAAQRDVPRDGLWRYRTTTFCEVTHEVADARYGDLVRRFAVFALTAFSWLPVTEVVPSKIMNGRRNTGGCKVARAKRGAQTVGISEFQLLGQLHLCNVTDVQFRQLTFNDFAALAFVLIFVALPEPVTNLCSAATCDQVAQLRT